MLRLAAFVFLLSAIFIITTRPAVAAEVPTVTLSGGDLPHSVKLARTDADAFVRRLGPPPKLDDAPTVAGAGYKITSGYWDEVLRNGRDDRAAVDADAIYFEEGGYVVAKQGGREVWLVLDLRQRAILDRYLSMTRAGLVRSEPGVLEVLTVASRSQELAIEIGGVPLDATQRGRFWSLMAVSPRAVIADPAQPPFGARGVWLVFALEEGRSVQVFYQREASLFVDFFGSELYPVSTPMSAFIDTIVPRTGDGFSITQEPSTGSMLWWVVMVGAGIACIGAAILVQRRLRATVR